MQTSLHSTPTTPKRIPRRAGRPSRRRATIVLEFIVVLPILLIVLVAIVLFGLFYANMQQVALAARVGAEEASQTAGLSSATSVPGNVMGAIERQLATSGITYCRVRLEHNVGTQTVLYSPSPTACVGGPVGTLPAAGPLGEYVRLTVTVRLTEVMPDTIGCFCFSPAAADKTAFVTSVFQYEL